MNQKENTERKNIRGVRATQTYPLAYFLSASVQLTEKSEVLKLYGTILAKYQRQGTDYEHELYILKKEYAQIVGPCGDFALKLGSEYNYGKDHTCIPLLESSISIEVKLFYCGELEDQLELTFADENFELDVELEGDDYLEGGIKSKEVPCKTGVLAFRYIVIPFGVTCCIDVSIFDKKYAEDEEKEEQDYCLDVRGSITAKHAENSSEGCVLFDKQEGESETVRKGDNSLELSRWWVALPAYSSLVVGLNLTIHQKLIAAGEEDQNVETEDEQKIKTIIEDEITLVAQGDGSSYKSIVVDDYNITVEVMWLPLDLHWPPFPTYDDAEGKEGNETEIVRIPRSREDGLHAIEVFSVVIGGLKVPRPPELEVCCSIEIVSMRGVIRSLFKCDDQGSRLILAADTNFLPLSDGSRVSGKFRYLDMKLNIHNQSDVAIIGRACFDGHLLDSALCYERQLCYLVRGNHGFAAVHYSVFSDASEATVKVVLRFNKGPGAVKVWGSLVAQYTWFDYSSKYRKDCFRSVMFKKSETDDCMTTQPAGCMTVPLSRSIIVVPSYSDLVLDVDLSFQKMDENLPWPYKATLTFPVGAESFTEKRVGDQSDQEARDCDYSLHFELEWRELK